jgi:DUF2075 family protein
MKAEVKMPDHITNRDAVLRALRQELVGPCPLGHEIDCAGPVQLDEAEAAYRPYRQLGSGEEILQRDSPTKRYGVGVLYPMEAKIDPQELEALLPRGASTGGLCLGDVAEGITVKEEPALQLLVPFRSFRSPETSKWVEHVLDGNSEAASAVATTLGDYPIKLTRSLASARQWLRNQARGQRRCGLVASSKARRLRADGLGVELMATDGADIAHSYLNPRDDIRSSFALEVTTNQYTCQGLELDFVGVCWGGDFVQDEAAGQWVFRTLSGDKWHAVSARKNRDFLKNSYRAPLTRAREGLVIWVPQGDKHDSTRDPRQLDATAQFLARCGARVLDAS